MFHHVDAPEKIVHITDQAFFDAVDLNHTGLENVQKAIQRAHYDDAFSAFFQHFLTRQNPIDPFVQTKTSLLTQIKANRELADILVTGGTYTFGQVMQDFSKPIDFNADFGDQSKYGFHYLIWMEPLCHAALETGEAKYVETYLKFIRQWYAVRDQIVGKRPMSPVFYELGLSGRSRRFFDFLHAVRFLNLQDRLTPDDIRIFFKSFLGAGRWLTLEQTTKGYRKGNWQLHGVWGLLTTGYLLPELKEAEQFRAIGADFLEQHMEQDYYADGGHSERCYSYGTGCLRHLSDATQLSEANANLVTPQRLNWREYTERAYRWFLKMTGPAGAFPGINDGVFSQSDDLLKRGFDFTGDAAFLYPIRHLTHPSEVKKPAFTSTRLDTSEFCVMRGGWEPDDAFMVINHGPYPGGHSHMGILDFNLYGYGIPLVAEVGRFGAYDNPYDMFFRSEQAHNHIVVEGAMSKRPDIRGEHIHFGTTQNFDFFSGRHRAYEETANVLIERRILFLKPYGFLISDTASSPPRRKSFLNYLHSPYLFTKRENHAIAEKDDTGVLVIPADKKQHYFAHTGIDYEESMTHETPMYTGQPVDVLWPNRYFMALRGWNVAHPITPFDILLIPYKNAQPHASINPLPCHITGTAPVPTLPRALEIKARDRTVHVIHSTSGVTVTTENITFSGLVAAIEYQNNRLVKAFVQNGDRLTVNGTPISLPTTGATEIDF